MGRPFLTSEEREQVITRIDRLQPFRRPYDDNELTRPVGPQYEKGEQIQDRKREKAREMPVMQLCQRMAVIMALVVIMAVGTFAKEEASPILSLHTDRIGAYDVLTTVHILPHAENMAVCVGLAGANYHARWGCAFVPSQTTTEVTIHWSDVMHGEYAVETGLWRIRRPTLTGTKLSLTFRRSFGVVGL